MKKLFALWVLLASVSLFAQEDNKKEAKKWDVSNPGESFNYIDVSPDGKTIVFDLLGDIYSMPISGGKAKALRSGIPFEVQPRFSPDGKHISFTSDAGGGDNIWIMKTDGSDAKQVTKESFRLLNNAYWTADGNYLIGRKHFTSQRSLGAGELWQYHITGGSGLQITKRKNDQQNLGEPCVSPDGKYVYFSEDVYPGGYFQYNMDPNSQIYVIKRYDFETGKTTTITGGPGGAARPQLSRDGSKLAFVKRIRTKSVLFLHDLETGEEWPLYDDSPVAPDMFDAKVIRHATTSPDGKTMVFTAVGHLWSKKLPNGKPKRLTTNSDFEAEPAFSPDGKELVFVTWNDENLGAVHKMPVSGGSSTKLTSEKGIYRTPSFSPSGNLITYRKERGNNDQGRTFTKKTGIYTINSDGSNQKWVSEEGEYPMFAKDGKRIFYQTGGTYFGNLTKSLKSVDLNGKEERTHVKSKYANRLVPSPDNNWIAFTNLHQAYIAPLVMTGKTIDLDNKSKFVPVSQLSRDAGINLHWSKDSQKVMWTLGDEYFSNDIKDRYTFLPDSPEKAAKPDSTGIKVGLQLKTHKPSGRIAFTNARIITMEGDEIIENGTIKQC